MSLLLKSVWRHVVKGNQVCRHACGARTYCINPDDNRGKAVDSAMMVLKSAPSTSDVLVAVQRHLPSMNHRHLLQAFRIIFEYQKDAKSAKEMDGLIQNPAFTILCHNLNKQARALEVNECIEALKIVTFLQMPVDSILVQTLLQLIRCHINNINIRQIMFVEFLLKKMNPKNHLVDALQLALPLVFQIHLPLELDQDDLPLLKDMLAFACHNKLPDRCINNIVTGLLLHDKTIDSLTAKSVIWSLCEGNCTLEVHPTRAKLLDICFDVLSQSLDSLPYEDVLRTAAKLKSRIVDKHPEFYHERLMDAIADYVIQSDMNFEQSMLVARVLSRIAHTHLGLVKHLCQQAASNPKTLATAQTNLLFAFINCLSNNNYVPENSIWTELRRQITANPIMDAKNIPLPWTKFTLESASLGHFDDRVLKRVFSQEFLSTYLIRQNNVLDYLQLLTLYEAVKVHHSKSYDLPVDVLDKARSLYPVHSFTDAMVEWLARGLGGSEYVVKNVVLPSGIIAGLFFLIFTVKDVVPLFDKKIASHGSDIPLLIPQNGRQCYEKKNAAGHEVI